MMLMILCIFVPTRLAIMNLKQFMENLHIACAIKALLSQRSKTFKDQKRQKNYLKAFQC